MRVDLLLVLLLGSFLSSADGQNGAVVIDAGYRRPSGVMAVAPGQIVRLQYWFEYCSWWLPDTATCDQRATADRISRGVRECPAVRRY